MRVEHYVDSCPEQVVHAERSAAAGQLAGDAEPGRSRALPGLHRAAHGRRRARSRAPSTCAPRVGLRLRPDRRQPHGAQGATTAASTSTRPTRSPTWRTRSATRGCAISSSMPNGNRLLDGPQELGAVPLDAGRRRLRPRRRQPQAAVLAGDLDAPRARDRDRPVGRASRTSTRTCATCGSRSIRRASAAMTIPIQRPRHRRRRRRRHRRRPDVPTCSIARRRRRRRVFTNPTDPAYNSDFHTVEFAVNRRFAGKWMLLTSFGYTWLESVPRSTSPAPARSTRSRTARVYNWRPNQRLFGDERQGNVDAVELQGDRPLRAAVGDRRLRLVEGAERPPVGPQHRASRSPATARRTSASSRSHRESRADGQHPRLPRRQERSASAGSARSPAWSTSSTLLNAGTVTNFRTTTGADVSSESSAFSTRASSGSACATTSRQARDALRARRHRGRPRAWTASAENAGRHSRARPFLSTTAHARPSATCPPSATDATSHASPPRSPAPSGPTRAPRPVTPHRPSVYQRLSFVPANCVQL